MKKFKKINYSQEVWNLHCRIFDAIAKLLKDNKLEHISFLGSDTAEVYFDWDGYVACRKADGVGYVDGALCVHIQDADCLEDEWEPIGIGPEVICCSIDTVYNCLFKVIEICCDNVSFSYRGKKYILRQVQPKDVGLANEVTEEFLLIAPNSLDVAIHENGDEGNVLDSQIYFYTDDRDLTLPYRELCKVLVDKGMD